MLNEPINNRYRADGKESFDLTDVQVAARDRIMVKLRNGRYRTEAVDCPLCSTKSCRNLSEKDTYGLPVNVVACTNCGLVFNNPRITAACLTPFYSEDYRELDRVLPAMESYFELENKKGRRIFQFLQEGGLLSHLKGKLIIDIGCGAGGVLEYFRQQGFEVLGCDLVPSNVEYGIREKQLDLHYGSLIEIEQIAAQRCSEIGLIIYEQVFEHLPNPAAELESLHRVLRPESLLFIGVPGLRNIDEQYGSDFLRYLQLPHLVHFDLEHLVALAESNGFEFLKGNEIAQAVFKKTTQCIVSRHTSYESTANFIAALERRRKKRFVSMLWTQFPHNLTRQIRRAIENLPLPNGFKTKLVRALRRVKRLAHF